MNYLPLIMLIPLAALIIGDFRRREVSVVWLVILATSTVGIPIIIEGWQEALTRSWQNAMVLIYLGIGIIIWGRAKAKKFVNPVNRYIGLGDILFFLVLVPLFPMQKFAWLLVASLLFSLVWWRVAQLQWFQRPRQFQRPQSKVPKTIPLVATSGIVMSAAIIFNIFSG